MSNITIALSDDRLARLISLAKEVGVAPEELARATLEEWLSRPKDDFLQAAKYVLEKNADLYRRLA